jgi:hypothetical protein
VYGTQMKPSGGVLGAFSSLSCYCLGLIGVQQRDVLLEVEVKLELGSHTLWSLWRPYICLFCAITQVFAIYSSGESRESE